MRVGGTRESARVPAAAVPRTDRAANASSSAALTVSLRLAYCERQPAINLDVRDDEGNRFRFCLPHGLRGVGASVACAQKFVSDLVDEHRELHCRRQIVTEEDAPLE